MTHLLIEKQIYQVAEHHHPFSRWGLVKDLLDAGDVEGAGNTNTDNQWYSCN